MNNFPAFLKEKVLTCGNGHPILPLGEVTGCPTCRRKRADTKRHKVKEKKEEVEK